jgi:pyruvate dehydrogenase E2 component (dihydrolipoamide acetyltransferase)
MTYEFRMPDIGEGIAEVEIVDWLVSVGDDVAQDQPVATVETDKARVDMPSPVAGTLRSLGAEPGAVLPVGAVLFTLDERDGPPSGPVPSGAVPEPAGGDSAPPEARTDAAPPEPRRIRVKAAPSVRRLADEQGIDLTSVTGTGPGGRVTKEDVLQAAAPAPPPRAEPAAEAVAAPPPPAPRPAQPLPRDEIVPLRGLRRQIAKNMVRSWQTIPHIVDWRQADARSLVAARDALRRGYPDAAGTLTYLPLLVKIVATALRGNPLMNASLTPDSDGYVVHDRINIGIATSTPDGLMVPVVRDADEKTVVELADEIAAVVQAARNRTASPEQLTGGTYTVNNLGALGATMGTPIIRSPEVGILGFGRITDTVVARDGQPAVVPVMTLSSVGDHRLLDGAELGAFTSSVVALVEDPVRLLGALR